MGERPQHTGSQCWGCTTQNANSELFLSLIQEIIWYSAKTGKHVEGVVTGHSGGQVQLMTLYHTITKPQPTVLIITLSGANYDFSNESIRVIVTPPSHQATCLQWREVSVIIKRWRLHSLCWWPAQVPGDLHQGNLVDCAILPTRAVTQAPPFPPTPLLSLLLPRHHWQQT